MRRKILSLVSFALAVCGCIYPYDAQVPSSDTDRMVIEGDIIIGGITEVKVSKMHSLNDNSGLYSDAPFSDAWVEDSEGVKYEANLYNSKLRFIIDTRTAPNDRQYRLCVKRLSDGYNYVSEWASVNPAPVVDTLTYKLSNWGQISDKMSDYTDVDLMLSAHSDEGCQYFRWTYDEVWKFHVDFAPEYFVDQKTWSVVAYDKPDYTTYYCWNSDSSSEVDLCATSDLVANSIVEKKFLTIHRNDKRLQMRYRITLHVRTISSTGFRYLENLKNTSNLGGSLFSPNPSEMAGNLSCIENPSERVIGFIEVSENSDYEIYIDPSVDRLFLSTYKKYSLFFPEPDSYGNIPVQRYFESGNVPVQEGMDGKGQMAVMWGVERCVNCVKAGGTLTKPNNWIDE